MSPLVTVAWARTAQWRDVELVLCTSADVDLLMKRDGFVGRTPCSRFIEVLKVYLHRDTWLIFAKSINGIAVLVEQSIKRSRCARAVYGFPEQNVAIASEAAQSVMDFG